MTKNSNKTAGQLSQELAQSTDKHEVNDIIPEEFKDITKKLENIVLDGVKTYIGNFFVVIESKRERLMPNVVRNYIFHRLSCPTPHYDQTVYAYNRQKDEIECLWSIPEKHTVQAIVENPIEYYSRAPEMTQIALDFNDGTLLHRALEIVKKSDKHVEELYG